MATKIKKLAILTSGGDSPGINNAIRAVVKKALLYKIEPFLVFNGYQGLVKGKIVPAAEFNVDHYIARGGSFIYSARFPEFQNSEVRALAKQKLEQSEIDALVVIGGDGSYKGAELLSNLGIKTICLPGTIDNDIAATDFTIGYDTALNSIVDNVERLKDTATSHNRTIIVEVMGRYCGDLALFSALATGANLVVTNENYQTPLEIANLVKAQQLKRKRGVIVIVAEHIYKDLSEVAQVVEKVSKTTARTVVLGHTQRGGSPTALERIRAAQMGMKAVELLASGHFNVALGIRNNQVEALPIKDALALPRLSRKELLAEINKLNQV